MPKTLTLWLILLTATGPALGQPQADSVAVLPIKFGVPSIEAPADLSDRQAPRFLPPPIASMPEELPLAPAISPLPPPPIAGSNEKKAGSAANPPPIWPTSSVTITEYTTLPRPQAIDNTFIIDRSDPWFDNVSFFAGLEGAKEPAELGVNGNFGFRLAANWAMPVAEAAGVGIQLGAGFNYSRSTMRVLHFLDGTVDHSQVFLTAGIFQRSEAGWNWGVAYDYRFDDYYDRIDSAQWRGQFGVPVGMDNEVGVWGTLRDRSTTAALGNIPFTVRALDQINFYWRHIWPGEAVTRVWLGFTEDHGRFSLFFPGESNVRHPICFGGDMLIPLNESLAIFGEAQFITPNDSGTVCATLGIAWFPGAARLAARNRFSPYLPVANDTTMPLDLRR